MPIPPLRNHIVLVSGQALPSLLGVSLPDREPVRIHAVVTPAMKEAARLLRKVLRTRGRKYTFIEYPLADGSAQDAIYDILGKIRAACGSESLGINLTGGTKLMALAAAEWAQVCEIPAFYIDTDGDQVISVARSWRYAPLPDVLSVRGLLAANGFDVEDANSDPVPTQRRESLVRLLRLTCTPAGERALGRLNRLAENAAQPALCVRDDGPADAAWLELLATCKDAGTVLDGNGYVAFPEEAARRWCNGSWFEEYVRMTLFHMKAAQRINDFASPVSVRREGVLNELDALFTARNRLFTIECKTSVMSGGSAVQLDRVASTLYKMDSLHDRLGGIFARAMLCSVRQLAAKDIERARTLGVRVICGKDLLSLEEKLAVWSNEA